jgi:tetratricopeptide (TPR) repeat protein
MSATAQARPDARASATTTTPAVRRAPNYGRRRAILLATVYLLFGLHIAHWRIAGKTLAPLELNEVLYTFELGIVTAGFLFMAATAVGTIVFGRFFCSWACHILALEDLCAWILRKLKITPKPVRSRALLLVPFTAFAYMFLWPQAVRIWEGRPVPALHLRTDEQGWASFITTDYWRNLPTIGVALATFAVCGFAIVYVLGTREFCTNACPYGTVFAGLDKLAPGRLLSKGNCKSCGQCTAACTSHIQVHEELKQYGTVVNSGCLKDLDCVAACPDNNIRYGFTAPPLLRAKPLWKPVRLKWDFSWPEEIQMALVGLATLVAIRGVYEIVPFLLALGISVCVAYLSVVFVRGFHARNLRFNLLQIRREGRTTPGGWAFLGVCALGGATIGHSGVVRWHERAGEEAYEKLAATTPPGVRPQDEALLAQASEHLEACARLGLVEPWTLTLRRGVVRSWQGDVAGARPLLERALAERPEDGDARLALARVLAVAGDGDRALALIDEGLNWSSPQMRERLAWKRYAGSAHDLRGRILAGRGDHAGAEREFRAALDVGNETAGLRVALAELLLARDDLAGAERELAAAVRLSPDWAPARFNHGGVLARLGRTQDAIAEYERCVALDAEDPDAFANLAWLCADAGRIPDAERHARRALQLKPGHAMASQVLARIGSR